MKRISIISFLFIGSLLITLFYSCVKEGLGDPAPTTKMSAANNMSYARPDSGCTICTENKEVILTPANFFGPYTEPGVEMNSKVGWGTIPDLDVQEYQKINVTVMNLNGKETAIPLFHMAADGSYESIAYKRGSSFLTITYVRFNKSTNTFTYKPVNNLTVKYSLSHIGS